MSVLRWFWLPFKEVLEFDHITVLTLFSQLCQLGTAKYPAQYKQVSELEI